MNLKTKIRKILWYWSNGSRLGGVKAARDNVKIMKKTDRLMPVVTIVIYYGEKVWDAETSLHGILDIPAEMVPYVNDYRMLLVEARQNNLYFHNGNNQDLFNLFEILLDQNNSIRDKKEKAIEYTRSMKSAT